jgi:hypothetical protein
VFEGVHGRLTPGYVEVFTLILALTCIVAVAKRGSAFSTAPFRTSATTLAVPMRIHMFAKGPP